MLPTVAIQRVDISVRVSHGYQKLHGMDVGCIMVLICISKKLYTFVFFFYAIFLLFLFSLPFFLIPFHLFHFHMFLAGHLSDSVKHPRVLCLPSKALRLRTIRKISSLSTTTTMMRYLVLLQTESGGPK